MSMDVWIWSSLSLNEKLMILKSCYPERSSTFLGYEANKAWRNLLPSTQADLNRAEWSLVVGKRP